MTFIQRPDSGTSNLDTIQGYTFTQPELSANEFVIIEDKANNRSFFGQVVAPQANLNRSALGPEDNTTINAFEALESGRFARDVVVNEVFLYEIALISDITDPADPKSIRVRPRMGAIASAATDDQVQKYLKLPAFDDATRLGTLMDTSVSLCYSKKTVLYQTLIAGATGQGKSNTCANLIRAAANLGFAVLVYDHKPDYQHMHLPNPDAEYGEGADVSYLTLGERLDGKTDCQEVIIPASDLDLHSLAAIMFPGTSEDKQRESVEASFVEYETYRSDQSMGSPWRLDDFYRWFTGGDFQKPKFPASLSSFFSGSSGGSVYNAVTRKFNMPSRRPRWIDGPRQAGGATPTRLELGGAKSSAPTGPKWFNLTEVLQPGKVVSIRIDKIRPREYGLFLDYMMRSVMALKNARKLQVPVLHHIDEAQDLFCGDKELKATMSNSLSEGIRKGRSREVGFSIAVQSAEQVPEEILNNLNTRIIHRHNNARQARIALEKASEQQLAMVGRFSPGEAMADIFGSTSVAHAKMDLSRFQLTTEELLLKEDGLA